MIIAEFRLPFISMWFTSFTNVHRALCLPPNSSYFWVGVHPLLTLLLNSAKCHFIGSITSKASKIGSFTSMGDGRLPVNITCQISQELDILDTRKGETEQHTHITCLEQLRKDELKHFNQANATQISTNLLIFPQTQISMNLLPMQPHQQIIAVCTGNTENVSSV